MSNNETEAVILPCWLTREETDPRYDRQAATFDPEPALWAPYCGHPACVEDEAQCPGFHDWECPVAKCRWDTLKAMCDLDQGHDGPHQFVSPDEIVLEFAPAEPAPVPVP